MAALIELPGFVGSAFSPQSKHVDAQELHEWYLEVSESRHAKVPTALLPCPGHDPFCVLPTSPVRGIFAQNDRCLAVGGALLYELNRAGTLITPRPMTALTTPAAPVITQSPLSVGLPNVAQPTITNGGTLGTTVYSYRVTAVSLLGRETAASVTGSTSSGVVELSPTAYNIITWSRVTGGPDNFAASYKVYRTAPGVSVLLQTVRGDTLFLLDVGQTGTAAAPPEENHTGGSVGETTFSYKIVARLGLGHTAASAEGTTTTGQENLTATDWNIVTWTEVPFASSYDIYRTVGSTAPPSSEGLDGPKPTPIPQPLPVLIGNTKLLTFNDTGIVGEEQTPPTDNTTATDTLTDSGTPVSWASSGDAGQQVLISAGGVAYCFDLPTNRLAKVADGCTAVGFIEGYFVILDAATSTLKSSELLDGFTWDDSQLYQRLNAGDRWLGMDVTSNEIWLLGTEAADVWQTTGNDETRFAPYNSITIDEGIIAPKSLNKFGGGEFVWLGQSPKGAGSIWRTEGYKAVRISTHEIERKIAAFSSISDAVGWSYDQEGHDFYVLVFPQDLSTFVYDKTTGEWHTRGRWDPDLKVYTAYRAWCHAFAFGGVGFGKHLVGDRLTGTITSLSVENGLDMDGSLIRRVRQSPHVGKNQQTVEISALVIDLEPGLGTVTGQGVNPLVTLIISKDNGKTWGKELMRTAGRMGDYPHRVIFNRLGDARDWMFRMVVSDPIRWRIARALYEPTVGRF